MEDYTVRTLRELKMIWYSCTRSLSKVLWKCGKQFAEDLVELLEVTIDHLSSCSRANLTPI